MANENGAASTEAVGTVSDLGTGWYVSDLSGTKRWTAPEPQSQTKVDVVDATDLADLQTKTGTPQDIALVGETAYRYDETKPAGSRWVPDNRYVFVFANQIARDAYIPTVDEVSNVHGQYLQIDTKQLFQATSNAAGGFTEISAGTQLTLRADVRDIASAANDEAVGELGIRQAIAATAPRTAIRPTGTAEDDKTVSELAVATDKAAQDLALATHIANLVITIRDAATAEDTKYPSEKSVRDLVDGLNLAGEVVQPFAATFAALGVLPADTSAEVRYWTVLTTDDIGTGDAANPQYPAGIYLSGVNQAAGWNFAVALGQDLVELTTGEVTSTSGADYTKFGTLSTERLDEWGRSRRMRRVFNHPGPGNFDFVGLNYPDRTAIFVRNVSSSNGISIDYGTGGANTLNITRASGTTQTISALDSFNIQPSEIAVVEKDGTQVYVSIFPGERVTVYDDYAQAVAGGFTPYDGLVLIRDTGELFGRKTSTNSRPFPADGKENVDWYKIGGGSEALYPGDTGSPTLRKASYYFANQTVGAAPTAAEGEWYEIGLISSEEENFDAGNPEPVVVTRYVSIEDPAAPGTWVWVQEGKVEYGGRTQFTFYASERLESVFFTISDYREAQKYVDFERHSLTVDDLTTGSADWTLDAANAPSSYTRLVYRHALATSGYDYRLDWRLVNGEYQFVIDDRHNWNTDAGTDGWGRYGSIREIVYKYSAVDPAKPTWQQLTTYNAGDVVIGKAPAGVPETQDSWYVMEAVINRPNTINDLDATEWNATNWTFTPLVPTKQSIVVDTKALLPDPATVLVGSVAAVTLDGANNGGYTAVGATKDQPATAWERSGVQKGTTAEKNALGVVPANTPFFDTNLGKLQRYDTATDAFQVVFGAAHQPFAMDWASNSTSGSGINFKVTEDPDVVAGVSSINLPDGTQKQIWIVAQQVVGNTPSVGGAGTLGGTATIRNDAGVISLVSVPTESKWANTGSWADLSYNQLTNLVADPIGITDVEIKRIFSNVPGAGNWVDATVSASDTVVYPGAADNMQVGVINIRYQDDPALIPAQIPTPVLGKEYVVTILPVNRGVTTGTIEGETTHYFGVNRGAGVEWVGTKGSTLSDDWFYTTDGMTLPDEKGQQLIFVDTHTINLPDFAGTELFDIEITPANSDWDSLTYTINEAAGWTWPTATAPITGYAASDTLRIIVDPNTKQLRTSIGGGSASLGAIPVADLTDIPAAATLRTGVMYQVLSDATVSNRGLYHATGTVGALATNVVPV